MKNIKDDFDKIVADDTYGLCPAPIDAQKAIDEYKTKYGIQVDKLSKRQWSFGICLSHDEFETYLFINFFKWTISIGKLLIDDSEVLG